MLDEAHNAKERVHVSRDIGRIHNASLALTILFLVKQNARKSHRLKNRINKEVSLAPWFLTRFVKIPSSDIS